jgi:hypothetical protein
MQRDRDARESSTMQHNHVDASRGGALSSRASSPPTHLAMVLASAASRTFRTSMIAMLQHIGIATRSAKRAALCDRTICTEGARLLGLYAHPEVSMHRPSLEYVESLERTWNYCVCQRRADTVETPDRSFFAPLSDRMLPLRQTHTAGRWPLRHKGFQQYRHRPAI